MALGVLALLGWLAPGACGHDEPEARLPPARIGAGLAAPSASAGALKLGLVLDASDPLAPSRRRGAELAARWLREQEAPGVELILGHASGPWSTLAGVARDLLCDQGCAGLITPPGGDAAHLMAQLAARLHVPLVALGGASSLTRVPLPWVAQVVPDQRAELRTLLESLPKRPSGPVPVVMRAGREGRRMRDDLVALARVLELSFRALPVDGPFDPGLLAPNVGRDGPIVIWLAGEELAQVLGTLEDLAWSGPVLLPRRAFEGTWEMPETLDDLSCRVVRMLRPASSRQAAFARACRLSYAVEPDEAAACAFDAVLLLAWALRAVPDGSAPFASLEGSPGLAGVTGPLRLDGRGRRLGCWAVSVVPSPSRPRPVSSPSPES